MMVCIPIFMNYDGVHPNYDGIANNQLHVIVKEINPSSNLQIIISSHYDNMYQKYSDCINNINDKATTVKSESKTY